MVRKARKNNLTKTKTAAIRTTLQTWSELERLAKTGLFGKTPSEVAEQLMREKLRELLLQGWPNPRPGKRGGAR